ncbi:hypothetical protein M378DRAFT_172849 [Amanita muscaria Koide BX008]|uniref:Uncharacterized protein n=1 Tax=Amanita muscaria (strain Koide BX008) TaxID=946122 RepID=A0A0C2S0V2_AMAMK|nr:hypothetical protein M378DRAFT_172849 [Amanita muscaria Koide BX008]
MTRQVVYLRIALSTLLATESIHHLTTAGVLDCPSTFLLRLPPDRQHIVKVSRSKFDLRIGTLLINTDSGNLQNPMTFIHRLYGGRKGASQFLHMLVH